MHRFLPLARSLALRYRGASEQLEDLIQVASLGLVKALDGFDLERGRSFMAYAAPTILGELRRHFRDRVWEVRLPRGLQERTMAVSEAAGALSDELGASPTVSQIAERLGWDDDQVSEALQADEARRTLSLDVPRSREESRANGRDAGRDRARATTRWRPSSPPRALRSRSASASCCRLRFEEDLNQYEIGHRSGSPRCRSRGSCAGRSASFWWPCRAIAAPRRRLARPDCDLT